MPNFFLRWQKDPHLFREEREAYLVRIECKYGQRGLKRYLDAEKEQLGRCKICNRRMILVGDHKPRTKKFRGLLCGWCNSILGNIERMPWVLKNIKQYLGN
jgi:hypothetical protein